MFPAVLWFCAHLLLMEGNNNAGAEVLYGWIKVHWLYSAPWTSLSLRISSSSADDSVSDEFTLPHLQE